MDHLPRIGHPKLVQGMRYRHSRLCLDGLSEDGVEISENFLKILTQTLTSNDTEE